MSHKTCLYSRATHWAAGGLLMLAVISAQAADPITVSNAWLRNVLPGQTVSAAYMNIKAVANVKLLSVETPVAGTAELHQTSYEGGVMKMRAIDKLDIPAGKVANLEPGGYHVMLTDVKRELKDSEHVPLTLTVQTDKGEKIKVTVDAEVRFVPDHKKMQMPAPAAAPAPMTMPMK